MNRIRRFRNHLEFIVLGCFLSSIFFYAGSFVTYGKSFTTEPYYFFIVQAISGILGVLLPYLLRTKGCFPFSPTLHCCYLLFLFFSLFLGELCHFYLFIPVWDLFLHFASGFLLFYASFEWFQFLSHSAKKAPVVSYFLLSILIALAFGSLWEIYEFISDGIFGTNMQRFLSPNGVPFFGREALFDTMEDLIFDGLGAICGGIFLIIDSKKVFSKKY